MPDNHPPRFSYSVEIQEIMGYVPKRIVRIGLVIIFVIFSMLLLGTYFISYPDVILAPVRLTTVNSPAPIVSKNNGRIKQWFVSDGSTVDVDSPIALLQSAANFKDIATIDTILLHFTTSWDMNLKYIDSLHSLRLGEVQNSYLELFSGMLDYRHYQLHNAVAEKVAMQKRLIGIDQVRLNILEKERSIKSERFLIQRKIFAQDSLFFAQNKFGIPQREFDQSRQVYLQEKENFIAFEGSIFSLQSSIVTAQQSLNDLQHSYNDQIHQYNQSLNKNLRQLEVKLNEWKETFLLTSPIRGKVTFTKYWSANQTFSAGDKLATIIPDAQFVIIGKASLSSADLGKVEIGQKVNIKLAGFSPLIYGSILGKVNSISMVPEDDKYFVEIGLSEGMVSSFKERLKFTHEMEGTAEIVIKDNRLIYKLLRI